MGNREVQVELATDRHKQPNCSYSDNSKQGDANESSKRNILSLSSGVVLQLMDGNGRDKTWNNNLKKQNQKENPQKKKGKGRKLCVQKQEHTHDRTNCCWLMATDSRTIK